MSSSEKRRDANRANALKSTGPKSAEGKGAASRNAIRHGLLSSRLLLDDECADAFARMVLDLQAALAPVGCMELALVERIAVTLWRQRRLVTAETAALTLARQPHNLARRVSEELYPTHSTKLKEEDMLPFDAGTITFCNGALAEVQKLDQIDLDTLPRLAPLIYGQLQSDAEDEEGVETYLKSHRNGLTGYVGELINWCNEQLGEAGKRPRYMLLAEEAKAKGLVITDRTLDILSRYQTTLDNQLYKALRALRDAQEWRLKTIESVPIHEGQGDEQPE